MTVHWRSTYGAGHIPFCGIFHYDFLGCHWLYSERLSPFKIKPIGLYFDTSSQLIFVWFFSANVLQSWLVPPDMRKDSDSQTLSPEFSRIAEFVKQMLYNIGNFWHLHLGEKMGQIPGRMLGVRGGGRVNFLCLLQVSGHSDDFFIVFFLVRKNWLFAHMGSPW